MATDIENKLEGVARTSFGKGASRQMRRDGLTPAVIYGHGTDPIHIGVDSHDIMLIVRRPNALIEIDLGDKEQLVLVKDVQKNPVTQIIEHVDLVIVKKGETVLVEVPINVTGEPFSGATFLLELGTLALNVPATAIPEQIEVSVEGMQDGSQILVKDIELPEGATAEDDPEQLIVNIVVIKEASEDDAAAETAETAETADAAEGEGDE